MTDDDALIAKAAEALRPYVPTGNGWLNASTNALFESNCHKAAVAVVEAVRDQIAAEALREAAADLAWKRPEACPCDHPDECCGSAASCDAMRPTQNVVGESWLRTRADRLDPGEGDRG